MSLRANYNILHGGAPGPMERAASRYRQGLIDEQNMANTQQAMDYRQMQMDAFQGQQAQQKAAAEAQAAQQAQYKAMLEDFSANPTEEKALAIKRFKDPEGMVDQYLAQRSEEQTAFDRANWHPLTSAHISGNSKLARSLAERSIAAYKKIGDPDGDIPFYQEQIRLIDSGDFDQARVLAEQQALMEDEKSVPEMHARLKDIASVKKTEAEADEIRANIPQIAQKMQLDQDKLNQLTDSAIKEINSAIVNSETQQSIFTKAIELTEEIDSLERMGGILTKGSSIWTNLWGGDEGTAWRSEMTALVNEDILGKRKPGMGPMSDNDYKVLRAGAPDVDADPKVVKRYLESLKRFSAYAARREELRAEFITQNKHMGNAKEPFEIGGHKVKRKMTFPQFMRSLGEDVYKGMEDAKVPKMPDQTITADDEAEFDSFMAAP